MMGGAKGQYDCVSAFIQDDWTDDLKKISVPVLVMNGDADQIVPHATSRPRAVEIVQNGTLKTYAGFPHDMRPLTPKRSTQTYSHSSSPDRSVLAGADPPTVYYFQGCPSLPSRREDYAGPGRGRRRRFV
jgi:dienelactone hydrolase